tara:strand:- start:150 stop:632 length:483 start_codon:yes stop_codon:yes gene_type:complete
MATRGRIGIKLTDGSILSAYHHWDSYPQWLGVKLVKNFNSQQLASDLIDGGDMSACYSTHTFESEPVKIEVIQPDGSSKWEHVQNKDGETVYTKVKSEASPQYYSERGENTPPRLDKDLFEFLDKGEEYAYVWEEGFWTCYDLHEFDDQEPEIVEIPQVL